MNVWVCCLALDARGHKKEMEMLEVKNEMIMQQFKYLARSFKQQHANLLTNKPSDVH